MQYVRRVAFGVIALALSVSAAGAGAAADHEKMQKYLDSEAFAQRLADGLANATADSMYVPCATFVVKKEARRVFFIEDPRFAEDGVPNAGLWKVETPIEGCGETRQFNLFFIARKDPADASKGKVFFLVGVPGGTMASPQLQKDTVRYAFMGAMLKVRGCKKFDIIDSRFAGGAAGGKAPWMEIWRLRGCGHVVDVPIDYTPDATGTQISVKSDHVVEVAAPADAPPPEAK